MLSLAVFPQKSLVVGNASKTFTVRPAFTHENLTWFFKLNFEFILTPRGLTSLRLFFASPLTFNYKLWCFLSRTILKDFSL